MSDHRRKSVLVVAVLAVAGAGLLAARAWGGTAWADRAGAAADTAPSVQLVPTTAVTPETDGVVAGSDAASGDSVPAAAEATFAGGCFWCMEPPFDALEGVKATTSGYAGGEVADPSYEQVSSGGTGHREVVQVTYDPSTISYTRLLEVFWHNIDPADGGGQFCDRGRQYTPAVYHHNAEQRRLAEASRRRLEASGVLDGDVETEIAPLDAFWAAENYHQNFHRKNPARYESYRTGCGRDRVLAEIWGEAAGH